MWPPVPIRTTLNLNAPDPKAPQNILLDRPYPTKNNPDGAFLDLGVIVHTVRVSVNGYILPALDVVCARADISSYLRNGVNSVEVVVSTPLGNALSANWGAIESSGKFAQSQIEAPLVAAYGLVGNVTVIPYELVSVSG